MNTASSVGTVNSTLCELICNTHINSELFRLDFIWPGEEPKAGQFFMIRPKRSAVFLGRPISMLNWQPASNTVSFLIARRGRGTEDLASMRSEEEAELIGPLGNAWVDFLPASGAAQKDAAEPIALIGGGVGIAPLLALAAELPENGFDFYAGFRTGFQNNEEKNCLFGPALVRPAKLILAAEDNFKTFCVSASLREEKEEIHTGLIPDFLEPADYSTVYACGPEAMLRTVAEKCEAAGVPCYVSMERRMACGVGACLGCSIATTKGNRRCCADGPVFPAAEVFF